jgi:hypothetical protein
MANTSQVEEARARGEVREMDCIDCHNRAAHDIPPPEKLVDEAIQTDLIDASLPSIRLQAVNILKEKYASMPEALAAMDGLANYYRTNNPKVYENQRQMVDEAISYLKQIYTSTTFPEMGQDQRPIQQREPSLPGCLPMISSISVNQNGNKSQ